MSGATKSPPESPPARLHLLAGWCRGDWVSIRYRGATKLAFLVDESDQHPGCLFGSLFLGPHYGFRPAVFEPRLIIGLAKEGKRLTAAKAAVARVEKERFHA